LSNITKYKINDFIIQIEIQYLEMVHAKLLTQNGHIQFQDQDSIYQLADYLLREAYPNGVPRGTSLPDYVHTRYYELEELARIIGNAIENGCVSLDGGGDSLAELANTTFAEVNYNRDKYQLSCVLIPEGDSSIYQYILFKNNEPQYVLPIDKDPSELSNDDIDTLVLISFNGLNHAQAIGIIKATLRYSIDNT